MPAGSFGGQYVWHPAADDRRLARACIDVKAGRYLGAERALRETRGDFGTRAHRSLVLASEAADSDLAERWLAEAPGPESALLWARVAMLRALRAEDSGARHTGTLLGIAETACERAALFDPRDPTPWTVRLALARIRRPRDPAPPGLLTAPPGPWPLLARALRLDPWNREAHHRFLAFYFARYGGTASARWDVASFLSHRAPVGSVLRLLPLVALAEEYDPSSLLAHRTWRQPQWVATALRGYRNWLPEVPRYRFTPVLDLSYLAHALYMGRQKPEAREVLTAMGPYAARMPWSAFGDPGDQLTRARRTLGLPVPAA
ncbi:MULTISPECIES: hypothetical protein [Streptomyces]|uniref:DUF4034 domain-containing protein n=1 Tax=Streptomyces tsukubensis (strain DSM 42081 / NBRC 108919 / NRRL 18488 / 9993) TaxID=1114943 RepID=I2MU01_STRT9|nr:hypothetical protein [Streptomyces tsukubensis]MYS64872.1 hypothetical protein [Streptomyces sp. SID5473]AZK92798.1 hypothetical protein B7R87_02055 [Streptomyces tsukubensis]EIF88248.1 hypothetical protein [Streptomyces tsukubensis NRRL18488]QKM71037.1 hypothetical protein STSU_031775 [Streptomyces tsukubensis NRRL18488]TAI41706.1 hypothetical protein EWI31_25560 [Streptomyces tsukubensis]